MARDLYPRLRERGRVPEVLRKDPVRFELMYQLGAFPTESSGHVSEYVPYFRTHLDQIAEWKGKGYIGESGFYAHNWPTWRRENDEMLRSVLAGEKDYPAERSGEYPSHIVEAMTTNVPKTIYVTTPNRGWVDNLDARERRRGGRRWWTHRGFTRSLLVRCPRIWQPSLATTRSSIDLAVRAILEQDRESAIHALMLDPLTARHAASRRYARCLKRWWSPSATSLPAFLH